MLEFVGVDTHYGDLQVLKSVDYRIEKGEIVCLLGGNASGKSTTMKAIMGSVAPTRGEILYEGHSLKGVSTAGRVRRGIAPVLEARRLFPRMTVLENLEMGCAYRKPHPGVMPRRNRLSWQDDRLFYFVLAVLASPFKSRVRVEAENAVLRHQLIVLKRNRRGRARLTNHDRLFFIQLYVSIDPAGCHNHPAGDTRALAQSWISRLLALEVAPTGRTTADRPGACAS